MDDSLESEVIELISRCHPNRLLVPLCVVVLSTVGWADRYDATNGVFGRGSYVGSDHWFASFTQSVLIQSAARNAARRSSTGAANENVPKGYANFDPSSAKYSSGLTVGSGYRPPTSDALWVRPQSDGSWKPPVIGPGYVAPQSDNNYKSPTVGPGLVRPQSDGDFKSPKSDGDYKSPKSDSDYKSPKSDSDYKSPKSDGDYKSPKSDGDYKSPAAGPGYVRPSEAAARGDEAVARKDLNSAINEYRNALNTTGSGGNQRVSQDARFSLGVALLSQQRPAEAAKELAAVVESNPSDDVARLMYGTALLFKGDAAEAEAQLARCSPAKTEGMSELMLGIAQDRQGKAQQAIRAYEGYLKWTDAPEVRQRLEELKRQTGREPQVDVKPQPRPTPPTTGATPRDLVGAWRVFSSRLFLDNGNASPFEAKPTTRQIELNADGTWKFGDSKGTWSVSAIGADDWKRWGINAYTPTRKVIFNGWDGGAADGPIEESSQVDGFWIIYRAQPPAVNSPGTVHVKFRRG